MSGTALAAGSAASTRKEPAASAWRLTEVIVDHVLSGLLLAVVFFPWEVNAPIRHSGRHFRGCGDLWNSLRGLAAEAAAPTAKCGCRFRGEERLSPLTGLGCNGGDGPTAVNMIELTKPPGRMAAKERKGRKSRGFSATGRPRGVMTERLAVS